MNCWRMKPGKREKQTVTRAKPESVLLLADDALNAIASQKKTLCSINRKVELRGFEPLTSSVQGRRSPG